MTGQLDVDGSPESPPILDSLRLLDARLAEYNHLSSE